MKLADMVPSKEQQMQDIWKAMGETLQKEFDRMEQEHPTTAEIRA